MNYSYLERSDAALFTKVFLPSRVKISCFVVVDKLRLQRIIYENTSRDLNIAQGLNLGIQKVYFASSQALYSFLLVLDLLIYPPTWLLAAPTYSQICSQSQAQNQHNDYFRLRSS